MTEFEPLVDAFSETVGNVATEYPNECNQYQVDEIVVAVSEKGSASIRTILRHEWKVDSRARAESSRVEADVDRFMKAYGDTLQVFEEAKEAWIGVECSRGAHCLSTSFLSVFFILFLLCFVH